MPHTPSAEKRLRKAERRRKQNRTAAKKVKLQRKAADVAVKAGDSGKSATEFKTTQTMLDRAAGKGYIHPNKAARIKSRLVKRMRKAVALAAPKATGS
jgi:small subunit ribosomal protein S20